MVLVEHAGCHPPPATLFAEALSQRNPALILVRISTTISARTPCGEASFLETRFAAGHIRAIPDIHKRPLAGLLPRCLQVDEELVGIPGPSHIARISADYMRRLSGVSVQQPITIRVRGYRQQFTRRMPAHSAVSIHTEPLLWAGILDA